MKMVLLVFYLSLISSVALSQGLVSFYNSSSTLVSAGSPGQTQLISPSSQATYYFGLCTAPPGTTDSTMFTFAGIYATNASVAGRLNGGFQAVDGWLPGVQESFFIAGWSASLGHDWNSAWLSGRFSASGFWGISAIGTGAAGGGGAPPLPALQLFNPLVGGISTGWNLNPVPEPSCAALLSVGLATLAVHCRNRKEGNVTPSRFHSRQ